MLKPLHPFGFSDGGNRKWLEWFLWFWTSTWIEAIFYEDTPRRGIRQHMEHTFEEAIRSEEEKGSKWSQNVSTFGLLGSIRNDRNVPQDISTMTVVQGLSKAAEKGAAKAEMKSKEVASFFGSGWSEFGLWMLHAEWKGVRCSQLFSGEG